MKRRAASEATLVMVIAMSLTMTADAATERTYTATAPGIESDVTVEGTFANGRLVDLQIDVSGETQGIGAEIGATMTDAILEAQSVDVDGVSGATITSNAVKEAAADIFAQAEADGAVFENAITGFRGYEWGTSKDVIAEGEINDDMEEDYDYEWVDNSDILAYDVLIITETSVGGIEAEAVFIMTDDGLAAGGYSVDSSSADELLSKYTDVYGDPAEAGELDDDSSYWAWADSNDNLIIFMEDDGNVDIAYLEGGVLILLHSCPKVIRTFRSSPGWQMEKKQQINTMGYKP